VKRWHQRIEQIALILAPSERKSSQGVENRLNQFIKEIETKLSKEQDQPFIKNLLSYSQGFWKGLFACYDHPLLPRTNNDLELFFRKVKTQHRRITGLRNWNRYIIRHGENVVFVDDALHDPDILSRLTQVEYETYKEEKTAWETRIFEQTKHLRFKKDPEKFLSELENIWLTE
jgi:hypothetical protein